jgi:hypothetical protein
MLMPIEGHFECDDCNYSTCDIFKFLEHTGVEFGWGVRLNKRFSFDMFQFLKALSEFIEDDDLEGAYDHVHSATLLMVNASGDDLDDFIEEAVVQSSMDEIYQDIEGMLKENE